MKEVRYSISEASRLLELENHVLRNWEGELGLIIPRNEQGYRYYREKEIRTLFCIRDLKNKGFQLKAIKEILPELERDEKIDVHKLLTARMRDEGSKVLPFPGRTGRAGGQPVEETPVKAEAKAGSLSRPEPNPESLKRQAGFEDGAGLKGFEPDAGEVSGSGRLEAGASGHEPGAGVQAQARPQLSASDQPGDQSAAESPVITGPEAGSLLRPQPDLRSPERDGLSGQASDVREDPVGYHQPVSGLNPAGQTLAPALSHSSQPAGPVRTQGEKMQEFEMIMGRIVGKALRDQAQAMGDIMGRQVSAQVTEQVDRTLEEHNQRTEEYFKRLDDSIRLHQKARQEAAAARDKGGRRKSRFFSKYKKKKV